MFLLLTLNKFHYSPITFICSSQRSKKNLFKKLTVYGKCFHLLQRKSIEWFLHIWNIDLKMITGKWWLVLRVYLYHAIQTQLLRYILTFRYHVRTCFSYRGNWRRRVTKLKYLNFFGYKSNFQAFMYLLLIKISYEFKITKPLTKFCLSTSKPRILLRNFPTSFLFLSITNVPTTFSSTMSISYKHD